MPSGRHHRRMMRAFFARYGSGPWTCVECLKPITKRGRESDSLNVHHIDENRLNDDPENLEPMHHACHDRNHTRACTYKEVQDVS